MAIEGGDIQPPAKRLKVNQEECISVQSSCEDQGDESVEIISSILNKKEEDSKKGTETTSNGKVVAAAAATANFGK
jgi:ribosomal protein L21